MVLRMASKIAKLILEHADSFLERAEAIDVALSLGMTLEEIQDYLDWVDSVSRGKKERQPNPPTARIPQENNKEEPQETQDPTPDGQITRQTGNSE